MQKHDERRLANTCWNRAADDEQVFVLLGRDPAMPLTIRAWVNLRIMLGKNTADDPQIIEALALAESLEPKPLRSDHGGGMAGHDED